MELDLNDLAKLVDAFEVSDWSEIHLSGASFDIRLSTSSDVEQPAPVPQRVLITSVTERPEPTDSPAEVTPPAPARPAWSGPTTVVRAPSVGIFWRAPSPQEPPYVQVGDDVQPETTLCIVEVMKLLTHVDAGASGRVLEIVVANGAMVEKGAAAGCDRHMSTRVIEAVTLRLLGHARRVRPR